MIDVLRLKDAQEISKKLIKNLVRNEEIDIENSVERIVATDIFSHENLPQFKRSTVDGYAVKASSTYGCSNSIPTILNLVGEVIMGKRLTLDVKENQCVYVPTGGNIPDDCDAVVMIEYCKKIDKEIMIYKPVKQNENVINVGDDIKNGSIIVNKGELLNSSNIGLLAGNGITKIDVYNKFNFSVISTGDEIIPINQKIEECKIRDINSYAIAAKLSKYGQLVNKYLVDDNIDRLKTALLKSTNESDVVFVSGGSSVGSHDYTIKAIEEIGGIIDVHGIAIKPGKPTIVAHKDNKIIIGLPGHPMAALMSLQLIFVEILNDLYCYKESKTVAKTSINFPSSPGKETVVPIKLIRVNNELYCEPIFYKSGLINILTKADGYIVIPENEEGIEKGTNVLVYSL